MKKLVNEVAIDAWSKCTKQESRDNYLHIRFVDNGGNSFTLYLRYAGIQNNKIRKLWFIVDNFHQPKEICNVQQWRAEVLDPSVSNIFCGLAVPIVLVMVFYDSNENPLHSIVPPGNLELRDLAGCYSQPLAS